jgi:hypothetical protein
MSPADNQLKVWMSKYGWSADESGQVFICSQEESIKPKNIVEKIDFDSKWPGAADCREDSVLVGEQCWVCKARGRACIPGLGTVCQIPGCWPRERL